MIKTASGRRDGWRIVKKEVGKTKAGQPKYRYSVWCDAQTKTGTACGYMGAFWLENPSDVRPCPRELCTHSKATERIEEVTPDEDEQKPAIETMRANVSSLDATMRQLRANTDEVVRAISEAGSSGAKQEMIEQMITALAEIGKGVETLSAQTMTETRENLHASIGELQWAIKEIHNAFLTVASA